jgi:hypothetical protein
VPEPAPTPLPAPVPVPFPTPPSPELAAPFGCAVGGFDSTSDFDFNLELSGVVTGEMGSVLTNSCEGKASSATVLTGCGRATRSVFGFALATGSGLVKRGRRRDYLRRHLPIHL